jgi:hypothetical protein
LGVSPVAIEEALLAKLIVLRKGGGGKVAINPELVTHVRSAAGVFTDVFFSGQQVAVEGTFEEIVRLLSTPERRVPAAPAATASEADDGLAFIPGR